MTRTLFYYEVSTGNSHENILFIYYFLLLLLMIYNYLLFITFENVLSGMNKA